MSSTSTGDYVYQEVNRLSVLDNEGKLTGVEVSKLFKYFTKNSNEIAEIEKSLKRSPNDEIRLMYLKELLTEQPGATDKRGRTGNDALTTFMNAILGGNDITAEQRFLRLPNGVTFLGERDEPSTLLIRKCYQHLLDVILDKDDANGIRNWLITGNPGIGKTYFAYFLLYVLIRSNQTVIFDSHSNKNITKHIIIFDQTRAFYLYETKDADKIREYLGDARNWYIVDARKPDKVSAKTVLVCSPRKDHYVDYEKYPYSSTRYMPVWSYEEILTCKNMIYPNLNATFVKSLFDRWGGIPRYVLEKVESGHQQKLKDAIETCEPSILEDIGASDSLKSSHRLIHIVTNPLIEEIEDNETYVEGGDDVEYTNEEAYTQRIYKFASTYVAQEVDKILDRKMKGQLRRELCANFSDGRSNSVLGGYFEELAHQLLLNGGSFNIRSLEDGTSNTKTFVAQSMNTFSDISTITNGTYYRPDSKNFPSIDAIVAPNELYQMTTTVDHSIKMVGLKKIYAKLAKSGEISYYFVVPTQIYSLYRKQKFTSTPPKNDVRGQVRSAQNMPAWIRNRVKQYVLQIDLSSKTTTETARGTSTEESSNEESSSTKRTLSLPSLEQRGKKPRGRPRGRR